MMSSNQEKDFKIIFLNTLIFLIPLSFILGNTIININIILIILSSIVFFKKRLFQIKFFFFDKLLLSFFLLIQFTGFYNGIYFYVNDLWPSTFSAILKSISFLRFFLLYIVIRFLISKDYLNFKYFFISSAFFSLFVSIDIFYQAIHGEDIFGYKSIDGLRKLSGPFNDEYIAGSYIQRFSLFTFFILPIFHKDRLKKTQLFLVPILFIMFLTGIILSGNRMPLILFILTTVLILIFHKNTRKYFILFIIIVPITLSILYNTNITVKNNYNSFYGNIERIVKIITSENLKNKINNKYAPSHLREFATFYDTWLMNKYFGGGIKNFRYYCHVRPNLDKNSKFICNMHPHNYYLEILTETGIFGFIIILTFFIMIIYISIIKKYFPNYSNKDKHFLVPFVFLFFSEIFPLKTTGSFFTTGNATYIFLILSIASALAIKYNLIEKK